MTLRVHINIHSLAVEAIYLRVPYNVDKECNRFPPGQGGGMTSEFIIIISTDEREI